MLSSVTIDCRKCLNVHTVCTNFGLNVHTVCTNFGLNVHTPVYKIRIRKCMCAPLRGPLKRLQGGPAWHNIIYYTHEKCFRAICGHEGPFSVMKGHFWCCFGLLWGPRGPLKRAQGGPTWHIIMLYTHWKCLLFRSIWSHAVTFWAILVILSHSWPFWSCFGPFWGPCGYLNGPRVVQHDI